MSRYNYDYLKTVEGEELIPNLMQSYYLSVLFLPWVAFITGKLLPRAWTLTEQPFVGIGLIIVGFSFRIWALRSLGRLWSQRCIYVPDMPRIVTGPYRFFRHPEYSARALEGIGFLLFFGLNPLSLLLYFRTFLFLARLTKVESRQLYELSAGPLQLARGSSRVGASKL